MPFHNNTSRLRKQLTLGLFVALALVLSYFERFLPLSYLMPGLKLGLANIITLIGLIYFGFFDMVSLVLVRVTMTAFFTGSMISFFYSLTGGLLSLLVMYLAYRFLKDKVSLVGISVTGAAAHNVGQALVLSLVTGSLRIGMQWLPYLLLAGLVTGTITGLVVLSFYTHWSGIKR